MVRVVMVTKRNSTSSSHTTLFYDNIRELYPKDFTHNEYAEISIVNVYFATLFRALKAKAVLQCVCRFNSIEKVKIDLYRLSDAFPGKLDPSNMY